MFTNLEKVIKTSEDHGDIPGAKGYIIPCYYELCEMLILFVVCTT